MRWSIYKIDFSEILNFPISGPDYATKWSYLNFAFIYFLLLTSWRTFWDRQINYLAIFYLKRPTHESAKNRYFFNQSSKNFDLKISEIISWYFVRNSDPATNRTIIPIAKFVWSINWIAFFYIFEKNLIVNPTHKSSVWIRLPKRWLSIVSPIPMPVGLE